VRSRGKRGEKNDSDLTKRAAAAAAATATITTSSFSLVVSFDPPSRPRPLSNSLNLSLSLYCCFRHSQRRRLDIVVYRAYQVYREKSPAARHKESHDGLGFRSVCARHVTREREREETNEQPPARFMPGDSTSATKDSILSSPFFYSLSFPLFTYLLPFLIIPRNPPPPARSTPPRIPLPRPPKRTRMHARQFICAIASRVRVRVGRRCACAYSPTRALPYELPRQGQVRFYPTLEGPLAPRARRRCERREEEARRGLICDVVIPHPRTTHPTTPRPRDPTTPRLQRKSRALN
jgi:hypothetical protein